MPESPTPDGWVRCRVGGIEVSVPPELANNRLTPKNVAPTFAYYQHDSRLVHVSPPADSSEAPGILKTASELCPWSERFSTMPRLRHACNQVSSDDFRWSMTPSEVRWHAFCITTGRLGQLSSHGHTESLFRIDADMLIHFYHSGAAAVDWQCTDSLDGGYMNFVDRDNDLEPTWVRAVCQSLRVVPIY